MIKTLSECFPICKKNGLNLHYSLGTGVIIPADQVEYALNLLEQRVEQLELELKIEQAPKAKRVRK